MFKTHSKFWIGNFNNEVDVLNPQTVTGNGKDYVKLASTLRAVSNFVQIVTGKNTPVKFHSKDSSYTDGNSVTISANIKDSNFDPTVGLALHEGSHIKLTDFSVMKNIIGTDVMDPEVYGLHTHDEREVRNRLSQLLNYVEDRRIDNYIYTTAPGYKPYYKALYDTYFNAKIVDKGLKSSEYRDETWDSYMFRLINITNENRDLDALNGLRAIWEELDLGNVSRLNSSQDAYEVAKNIYHIIDGAVHQEELDKEQEGDDGEGGDEKESTDCQGESSCSSPTGTEKGETPEELSPRQLHSLKKAIEKQEDFTNGNTKKSNMTNKDKMKVQAIKNAGVTSIDVGNGSNGDWYSEATVECIVIKNVTKQLIESGVYPSVFINFDDTGNYKNHEKTQNQDAISRGTRLGNMLGRKLQIRNTEKTLKYGRLRTGKIDRRALSGLGYGVESVFQKVLTSAHTPSCLHISIDASGSMSGSRWRNSLTAATAIAKAASMTTNMDVVISFRSVHYSTGLVCQPLMVVGYDSRKDKFAKIPALFSYLTVNATTPAGLCFEAIMKDITEMGDVNTDKYFINFSDGDPYFETTGFCYAGPKADAHVRAQVNKMKAAGVNILSYFIDGTRNSEDQRRSFDHKYGKDNTAYISVTDIVPLTKTLNSKFVGA